MSKKIYKRVLDKNGVSNTKCYTVWSSMLGRCYLKSKLSKDPTYTDCEVCEEWHTYSNFEKWFTLNYKEGWQLDKDILKEGNRIYSPDTCCFVPGEINTMMISKQRKNSSLPTGVSEVKNGKYQVIVKEHSKPKRLGTFDNIEQAYKTYCNYKKEYIKTIADKYYLNNELPKNVYDAILNHDFIEKITKTPVIDSYIEPPSSYKVLQIKNEEVINSFNTLGEAGRYFGNTKLGNKIGLCCRGLKKNYKGYEWKFEKYDK